VFTADTVAIHLHDELLLKGHRSSTAPTLWTIPLQVPPPSTQLAATAVNTSTKPPDLVAFAHASLFSPALTTLAQALRKDYVVGFPGLTSPTLAKYPPMSMATAKGHLDQARQHPHRVSAPPGFTPNPSDPDHLDFFPSSETPINQRTHLCFSATIQATGQISSDQTGKFPLPSSTGNNYIFVLYDYDSNSIHAVAIKNRSAPSILAAYKIVFQRLTRAGLTPRLARLDNECSAILKQFFYDEHIDFQLAPPHIHRRNAAERAVRTFKNHLLAGLSTCDANFPLHLWDTLLPQAQITLNLLCGSRINPNLSAHAQVFGHYNFSSHPIGPPLAQKFSFMRSLPTEPPGLRMPLKVGTWALPWNRTGATVYGQNKPETQRSHL